MYAIQAFIFFYTDILNTFEIEEYYMHCGYLEDVIDVFLDFFLNFIFKYMCHIW